MLCVHIWPGERENTFWIFLPLKVNSQGKKKSHWLFGVKMVVTDFFPISASCHGMCKKNLSARELFLGLECQIFGNLLLPTYR